MRTSAKLGVIALIAALLLSAAVSTASARNLSVSNRDIRVTWRNLEFVGTVTVRCQVTIEGSFHARTIPKRLGTLIGVITRAPVNGNTCINARMATEGLPWHITYEGFIGTLPRLDDTVILVGRSLLKLINVLSTGVECRYGTATDNITSRVTINEAQEALNLIPVTGRNIATLLEARDNAFLRCPATGTTVGSTTEGIVTLLNSSAQIRFTLI